MRRLPRDCKELYQNGNLRDGVYTIDPGCGGGCFQVYCDMKNGGYIVFQRRQDGSVNFNRHFESYEDGFGSVHGEHWLGLEKIKCLTSKADRVELRIDMVKFDGSRRYARYSHFALGPRLPNADSKSHTGSYALKLGTYSGNAGDSFRQAEMSGGHREPLDGLGFSTRDIDNDHAVQHCGHDSKAGWWFRNCAHCNLNGPYSARSGVYWRTFAGFSSLKFSEMKLRSA